MKLVLASTYWNDLKNAIEYFEDIHQDAVGLRLLDALEETFEFVLSFPEFGSLWETETLRWGRPATLSCSRLPELHDRLSSKGR